MSKLELEIEGIETTLERAIDSYTLTVVLEYLSEICHGKAEHIETDWQDGCISEQAKPWTQIAGRLSTLSQAADNKGL